MVSKLSKHLRTSADEEDWDDESFDLEPVEEEPREIDPRWNELKKSLDNT